MKRRLLLGLCTLFTVFLGAQDLVLGPEDVYIEARSDGYHLFIRAREGLGSVLLTESFELEDNSLATYALRAFESNEINGRERRLLNGQDLPNTIFSLLDSTPEPNERFGGPAFRILLPPRVQYGYPNFPNTRYGVHDIREKALSEEGYWFSIRAFTRPFADYSGPYRDNAFEIRSLLLSSSPPPAVSEDPAYHASLRESFERISRRNLEARGPEDLVDTIREVLGVARGRQLDLILAVDTTKSMVDELNVLKRTLLTPIREETAAFERVRIGFIWYRDYMEEYLTRIVNFQEDWAILQRELNRAQANGGGDIPEAVNEALWAGLSSFSWEGDARLLILTGDAPPHPVPRGSVTEAMVIEKARDLGVEIITIMLPF